MDRSPHQTNPDWDWTTMSQSPWLEHPPLCNAFARHAPLANVLYICFDLGWHMVYGHVVRSDMATSNCHPLVPDESRTLHLDCGPPRSELVVATPYASLSGCGAYRSRGEYRRADLTDCELEQRGIPASSRSRRRISGSSKFSNRGHGGYRYRKLTFGDSSP